MISHLVMMSVNGLLPDIAGSRPDNKTKQLRKKQAVIK